MADTSLSLLHQLKKSDDSESWSRLVALYRPLLISWLLKYEVQSCDADDLVQEVLIAVSEDIASFDHNGRPGAFRAWLRMILVYRLRDFWRSRGRRPRPTADSDLQRRLADLADPASELSQLWNQQHDLYVAQQLLAQIEPQFAPRIWAAFKRLALDGHRADVVAAELGMTTNAVFIAKSRVLTRLRQQAAGLIADTIDFPK